MPQRWVSNDHLVVVTKIVVQCSQGLINGVEGMHSLAMYVA